MGAFVMGSLVTRFGGAVELDSHSVLVTHIAKNSPIKVAEEIKGQVRALIPFAGAERVLVFCPILGCTTPSKLPKSAYTFSPTVSTNSYSDSIGVAEHLRRRGYKCSH